MSEWQQWVSEKLQSGSAEKLMASLAVLIILWGTRRLILRAVARRSDDPTTVFNWRKGTGYTVVAIGSIWLVNIWIQGTTELATIIGLFSAGLAIALQDLLADLFGWAFIMSRRPFELGDRIEIGDHAGDVVDIRFFQFTLLEIRNWVEADHSTGRVLHLPNKMVFDQALANFSKGFTYIWNEIPVVVTFESNWRKSKQLLLEVAERYAGNMSEDAKEHVRRVARRYLINYPTLTPTVYTRVDASGVRLTIRYLCLPRQRRDSEQEIWEQILDIFAQNADMEFAYPTQRFYFQPAEGRPAKEHSGDAEQAANGRSDAP